MVNFHTRSRKSENLHFDGLFLSKAHKFLDEKVQETLCLMTLKSDAKFDRKLTLGSKSDMRNLVNFIANSGFKNLHFAVLLLLKRYYVWAKKKKYREVIVITLKNDVQFEEELTCALKNDMKNYTSFENIKICTLVGSFWPKYIMFELKKYRKVMCDYTEDRCKLWRKVTCSFINDMRNLVNLKNHKTCTLRDFFRQRCIMLN